MGAIAKKRALWSTRISEENYGRAAMQANCDFGPQVTKDERKPSFQAPVQLQLAI